MSAPATVLACIGLLALGGCGINSKLAGSSGACGGPPAEPGPDGCALACRGTIPVTFVGDTPQVTVWINDKPVDLTLDTGAGLSSITTAAASRLGVGPPRSAPGQIYGIGGPQPRRQVDIATLAFGNARFGPRALDVLEYAKSTAAAAGPPASGALGALGADVLAPYDVDLDFPHNVVRLYQGNACPGPPPGWTSAGFVVPFGSDYWGRQAVIPARLDGQDVQAVIDSGAERSGVSERFARAAHVSEAELASELSTTSIGFGPDIARGRMHQFHSLTIGPETIPLFEAEVLDLRLRRINMLLGDDYLRSHKAWISFPTHEARFSAEW